MDISHFSFPMCFGFFPACACECAENREKIEYVVRCVCARSHSTHSNAHTRARACSRLLIDDLILCRDNMPRSACHLSFRAARSLIPLGLRIQPSPMASRNETKSPKMGNRYAQHLFSFESPRAILMVFHGDISPHMYNNDNGYDKEINDISGTTWQTAHMKAAQQHSGSHTSRTIF